MNILERELTPILLLDRTSCRDIRNAPAPAYHKKSKMFNWKRHWLCEIINILIKGQGGSGGGGDGVGGSMVRGSNDWLGSYPPQTVV